MSETQKPNFRKQPVPPPPVAAVAPPAPGGGKLPVQDVVLSTRDKEQLSAVGWKEGDHIPPDFAQKIKEAQRRSVADTDQARDDLIQQGREAGGRVKVGRELNLSDLPEAEQAKLQKVLADYQQQVVADQAQQAAVDAQEAKVVQHADPSVQQAHRVAIAADEQLPEVEIRMPDTPPKVEDLPPQLRPREGAVVGGAENIAPFVTDPNVLRPPQQGVDFDQARQDRDAEQQLQEAGDAVDAGGAPTPTHCPRCLFDVRTPWELEVEDADKELFVAVILGGSRFSKTIAVMGELLRITYRSLTSPEVDLCFRQLGLDLRQGKLLDDAQYFMQLQAYRLVMSVDRVETGNNECLVEIPPIFEIEYDPPAADEHEETRLIPMVKWFNETAVTQESLRRIIAQHHRQFQRLVEALEAMTTEPDFWSGIKSPT
jgi:hypothetical protein